MTDLVFAVVLVLIVVGFLAGLAMFAALVVDLLNEEDR